MSSQVNRRDILALAGTLGVSACVTGKGSMEAPGAGLLVDPGREPDEVISLWPAGPPGGEDLQLREEIHERTNTYGLRDRAATSITEPTVSVFRPANPDGSACLLIPGGGYARVVIDKEGYEGARHFNRHGMTCYVLKYRLPGDGWMAGPDTPLQDAQRAMRLIRSRTGEDGINPDNIMVMGFSAGGHVAGSLCQRFDTAVYQPQDRIDDLPARPDLGVLVYPVTLMVAPFGHEGSRTRLLGEAPQDQLLAKYDLTTAPNPAGPDLFLLHTLNDASVPVENTFEMAMACHRVGVPAVVHAYEEGEHGFGMRGIDHLPVGKWPMLVLDWMRRKYAGRHVADHIRG